jgi:ATP-binding cassette, subfamily C, bacterial CydD
VRGSAIAPSPREATVRLEGVSFSSPGRPGDVLRSLDLELRPGETVALVGPSGAGKSTVASLLLLLAQPSSGRVTAGGTDLAECNPQAWRANIAWVPQRPTLFHGTVAENIALGEPRAGEARIRAAAELAGADAFIRRLPDGYGTIVGDGGRALSAGERRRIAIARAFLRDAPLVILDEPTANLDRESGEVVGDALVRLGKGRTVLLIAHDDEVVRHADRAVRLDSRRIVEAEEARAA